MQLCYALLPIFPALFLSLLLERVDGARDRRGIQPGVAREGEHRDEGVVHVQRVCRMPPVESRAMVRRVSQEETPELLQLSCGLGCRV